MVNIKIRLIIFFAAENGEALYSQQTRPEADCGTDHEPLGCRYLYYILQMRIKGVKYFPIVTQPVSGQAGALCCCESEVRLIT